MHTSYVVHLSTVGTKYFFGFAFVILFPCAKLKDIDFTIPVDIRFQPSMLESAAQNYPLCYFFFYGSTFMGKFATAALFLWVYTFGSRRTFSDKQKLKFTRHSLFFAVNFSVVSGGTIHHATTLS